MTNKQYVFSGTGNPYDNDITPDVATAHYVDVATNDVWMWNGADWNRVYVGGSIGMVAMYHDPSPLGSPPKGPSIVSYNGECYVSYEPTLGEFAWQKLTVDVTP